MNQLINCCLLAKYELETSVAIMTIIVSEHSNTYFDICIIYVGILLIQSKINRLRHLSVIIIYALLRIQLFHLMLI